MTGMETVSIPSLTCTPMVNTPVSALPAAVSVRMKEVAPLLSAAVRDAFQAALIGLMVFSFARVGAALGMQVEDL